MRNPQGLGEAIRPTVRVVIVPTIVMTITDGVGSVVDGVTPMILTTTTYMARLVVSGVAPMFVTTKLHTLTLNVIDGALPIRTLTTMATQMNFGNHITQNLEMQQIGSLMIRTSTL